METWDTEIHPRTVQSGLWGQQVENRVPRGSGRRSVPSQLDVPGSTFGGRISCFFFFLKTSQLFMKHVFSDAGFECLGESKMLQNIVNTIWFVESACVQKVDFLTSFWMPKSAAGAPKVKKNRSAEIGSSKQSTFTICRIYHTIWRFWGLAEIRFLLNFELSNIL